MQKSSYTVMISIIVALGGFLLGFDSALISGVIPFIRDYFELTEIALGWSVSAVLLGGMAGNLLAGPLSNQIGRKKSLLITAVLFTISAITSAIAQEFWFFIIARMIGGIGIGIAILVAPVYIAEIAPPAKRGKLVSINQLNIVIGISLSFFSNRLLYELIDSEIVWRWMLGVETIPALLYFIFLFIIPESPRWLVQQRRTPEAEATMLKVGGEEFARVGMSEIRESLKDKEKMPFKKVMSSLFSGKIKYFLVIGIVLGMLQQFTGINSIFYYSPEIFEKAGSARDSALLQAIIIGLTNLAFTIVAMSMIDKFGRRKLLLIGAIGMALAHLTIGITFKTAEYKISEKTQVFFEESFDAVAAEKLVALKGTTFESRSAFLHELDETLTKEEMQSYKLDILKKSVVLPGLIVLIAIIVFVASFAVSIGPVMWVLLSEIFPNHVRGMAISIAGFFNGTISFLVTFLFPWLLDSIGEANTFFIFSGFMIGTFIFVKIFIPETKGKSLEEIEKSIVKI
ncbi:MAG: sugar porter family MFS transporter [Bacteroidales bacterium]